MDKCENITDDNKYDCSELFNCCDCGVEDDDEDDGCGCAYCWSCNACDTCKEHN